jgi:hypothetical protein
LKSALRENLKRRKLQTRERRGRGSAPTDAVGDADAVETSK